VATIPEALALAQQAVQAGDRARAQTIYQQILQAVPEEPQALNDLGMLFLDAGQLDAAERHVRRAIAVLPRNPAFHNNLSSVHRGQGRPKDAVVSSRRALELDPGSAELHNSLAIALQEAESYEEAVASFRNSIERNPTYAEVHYNLARTLVLLLRLDEAEKEYARAIQLAPTDFESHNNRGTLLQLQGKVSDALACYEATLRCRPDSAQAHRNRALLRLLLGDFAKGWPEYEWRWRMPDIAWPNYSQPRWQGESLAGRTILLWSEQGIGDVIQFVRYAALVKQAGAQVLVGTPASLHALLKTAPGIDCVVLGGVGEDSFDFQIPLMSLPAMCGTTLETIPAMIPYLHAEPERIASWRETLAAFDGFKVGIGWQGSPNFKFDCYRSMPLACFAPLAGCEGVKLLSLQKGVGREQLAPLADTLPLVDLGASLDEGGSAFVDTAAAMMNLDLVITSDTAIAHLAGALGVPVWVALQYAPDWRWQRDRRDSPWYPTMRLFRQTSFGDWDGVFAQITAELRSLSVSARSN
jgi:tetratricopeptide (TPR) repeat protein